MERRHDVAGRVGYESGVSPLAENGIAARDGDESPWSRGREHGQIRSVTLAALQ